MKHALTILENALEAAQKNEPIHRAAGDRKQARLDSAVKWDCLEAIQLIRRTQAEHKKGGKP